jgi:hypothetical protein
VELLVAMAIFAVLGVALIALLRSSTAFLERGQAGSETLDVLEGAERMFGDDFANVYIRPASLEGMPDARFLCDAVPFDRDQDGLEDLRTQRLCFVRSVQGEAVDPVLRRAGAKPGASAVVDGVEDSKESEEGDHRAPGGKQEVCWALFPAKKDGEPGLMTLYRGQRLAMGGGTASLLPQEPAALRKPVESRMGVTTEPEAEAKLRPVLTGVLHVSYRFWTRHTRPEAVRLVAGGRLADEAEPGTAGGLTPTWDSTRGILPAGTAPGQFFLARGPASLLDPVDDVFPSRVRLTLVVDRIGKDARFGELARGIGPDETAIPVDRTDFAPGGDPAARFVKIEDEWIRWGERDGRRFVAEERGARGTRKTAHPAGAAVRAGATLVKEYAIPAFREDWND